MIKKHPRRKPVTPRSTVKRAIMRLFLQSRERAAALKRDGYACVDCGLKQSRARGKEVFVEVDHLDGIDWQNIIDYIFRHVLVPPEKLETVCRQHHDERGAMRKGAT